MKILLNEIMYERNLSFNQVVRELELPVACLVFSGNIRPDFPDAGSRLQWKKAVYHRYRYRKRELCIAIAEGKIWFQWKCAQGKVLYVNLELDRASCLCQFKDVCQALGWNADNLSNIDIWNPEGKVYTNG